MVFFLNRKAFTIPYLMTPYLDPDISGPVGDTRSGVVWMWWTASTELQSLQTSLAQS